MFSLTSVENEFFVFYVWVPIKTINADMKKKNNLNNTFMLFLSIWLKSYFKIPIKVHETPYIT